MRERDRVAAVLAEEALRAGSDVLVVGALGARVHRHDDEVGPRVGLLHERLRPPGCRVRLDAHGYGAKPSTAIRVPRTLM